MHENADMEEGVKLKEVRVVLKKIDWQSFDTGNSEKVKKIESNVAPNEIERNEKKKVRMIQRKPPTKFDDPKKGAKKEKKKHQKHQE